MFLKKKKKINWNIFEKSLLCIFSFCCLNKNLNGMYDYFVLDCPPSDSKREVLRLFYFFKKKMFFFFLFHFCIYCHWVFIFSIVFYLLYIFRLLLTKWFSGRMTWEIFDFDLHFSQITFSIFFTGLSPCFCRIFHTLLLIWRKFYLMNVTANEGKEKATILKLTSALTIEKFIFQLL